MVPWPSRTVAGRSIVGRKVGRKESLEISTRSADKAGELLREAHVEPKNLLSAGDSFLFLIHGFANSRDDAEEAYRRLTTALDPSWQKRVVHVFWPGDGTAPIAPGTYASWLYPFTSKAEYSWQPTRAVESAQLIADLIGGALYVRSQMKGIAGWPRGPLVIYIVAHSLGCRLTLELFRNLRVVALHANRADLEIRLAVLMAGAVPLFLLTDRAPLASAMEVPSRTLVYHSKRDRALGFVFRLGQAWESTKPMLPFSGARAALGRRGISEIPGRREVYHTGLGHSDYWTNEHIASDIRAALAAYPGPSDRPLIQSRFAAHAGRIQPRQVGA
jgi:alpha/beta hydrolase family protein DUF900